MRVNCTEILYNTDIVPVNIYNDSNHPIYAVDIYITSNNANFLLPLLDEAEDGTVILTIDGIVFQIKKGLPGESALNPITYIKSKDIAKLIELRDAKIPYKEIAKVLKRGVDACIIKYKNIKKDMLDRKIIVKVDTLSNTK